MKKCIVQDIKGDIYYGDYPYTKIIFFLGVTKIIKGLAYEVMGITSDGKYYVTEPFSEGCNGLIDCIINPPKKLEIYCYLVEVGNAKN